VVYWSSGICIYSTKMHNVRKDKVHIKVFIPVILVF